MFVLVWIPFSVGVRFGLDFAASYALGDFLNVILVTIAWFSDFDQLLINYKA